MVPTIHDLNAEYHAIKAEHDRIAAEVAATGTTDLAALLDHMHRVAVAKAQIDANPEVLAAQRAAAKRAKRAAADEARRARR